MPFSISICVVVIINVFALTSILTAFETEINEVNLTPDERKAIFKTGPDRVSFVQNASAVAKNNPNIFPASFSTQEFQNDVELFAALTELGTLASSVASQIDDTRLAVGGEAMRQATQVYNYVKEASKTTPGLKPLADQLGERFQKAGKPKETPTPKA
ncbi:MAG: hypothetical protein M3444_04510 [Acidobacteriota bacterium]|nr:hypothetical protein [Acidobacteriota bacterium]MDQ5839059.1 hypothetical protein [Acidobacteriota bacterium]